VSVIHTFLVFGQMRILTRSFQLPYTFSVWCAVLDDQMIGPFIFEVRLRHVYLRIVREELPQLLEDVPVNKRRRL